MIYDKICVNKSEIQGISCYFTLACFSFCKYKWSKTGVFWHLELKITIMGTSNYTKTYNILKVHFKCFPTVYNTSYNV